LKPLRRCKSNNTTRVAGRGREKMHCHFFLPFMEKKMYSNKNIPKTISNPKRYSPRLHCLLSLYNTLCIFGIKMVFAEQKIAINNMKKKIIISWQSWKFPVIFISP
jgi:hypothetical protein